VRVIHVAETIKGGIATYLRYVLPLQAARYGRGNIRILVPLGQIDELADAGVLIQSFPRRRSRVATALVAAQALRLQLAAFRPDIVHVHSSFAGLTCRPLVRLAPRHPRIVYCPHGWSFTRVGHVAHVAAWVERRLARLCAKG